MRNKYILILAILLVVACISVITNKLTPNFITNTKQSLPLIAIANYGPHSSLEESIVGIKKELSSQGYIEHKNIEYLVIDVGFDTALIPQMISSLKSKKPTIIVAQTTPIAQFAKHAVKDIPLIFTAITDPITAGLQGISGSSDKQDLRAMLQFSKLLMPAAKRVGLLYSTAEANDLVLVKMMKEAIAAEKMQLVCVPIEHARDVPLRMQLFNNKVDIIYVGMSGMIQPSLPAITASAKKMGIAVLNADSAAVKQGPVLASFGVDYHAVGMNAGKLIAQTLLDGEIDKTIYPALLEHKGFVNEVKAKELGLKIPTGLANVTVVR